MILTFYGKKLTVFFSDIVNFTDISDELESEEMTNLLNFYLNETIKKSQGRFCQFGLFPLEIEVVRCEIQFI